MRGAVKTILIHAPHNLADVDLIHPVNPIGGHIRGRARAGGCHPQSARAAWCRRRNAAGSAATASRTESIGRERPARIAAAVTRATPWFAGGSVRLKATATPSHARTTRGRQRTTTPRNSDRLDYAALDWGSAKRQSVAMASFVRQIPDGDNRERMVCADCGHIAYENPKVVVGSVVVSDGAILMCRRAIEPRMGYWTLPAGYLELGETLEEGAIREAREEANSAITLDGILGVFSIARIGQVQVIFQARFADEGEPRFSPGEESLDVRLFRWEDIPWSEIAFPSVHWGLQAWRSIGGESLGAPARNPLTDLRGVHPMVPSAPTESDGL